MCQVSIIPLYNIVFNEPWYTKSDIKWLLKLENTKFIKKNINLKDVYKRKNEKKESFLYLKKIHIWEKHIKRHDIPINLNIEAW